jgi:Raf kinase inhibitor-like YbhB/YbcL family protein
MRRWMVWALVAGLIAGCAAPTVPNEPTLDSGLLPTSTYTQAAPQPAVAPTLEPDTVGPMALHSPAFEAGGEIPPVHTCDGENISPELAWENVPQGTAALALVLDDPDAGHWVHWVAYDLPAELGGLPAGLRSELPGGGRLGSNTWGKREYGGPCPPTGRHRYVFSLYALDSELGLPPGATAEDLAVAAEGHILATAELAGTYACG